MGFAYLQRRSELVARCAEVTAALGVKSEAAHDAVLLMDRVMSTSLNLAPDLLNLLAAACVVIAAKQVDGPVSNSRALPTDSDLHSATGLPAAAVDQMEWHVRQVLAQDTAAISTLRCLKLYLERLGSHHMDAASAAAVCGGAFDLADDCLTDMSFLNCRPSVIAAAVVYTDRRARGIIPFWPTMLAKLTGYQDMSTPELSVAIKSAQRVHRRSGGGGGGAPLSSSILLPTSASAGSLSSESASVLGCRQFPRVTSEASSLDSSNFAASGSAVTTTTTSSSDSSSFPSAGGGGQQRRGLTSPEQAVLLALQKGEAPIHSSRVVMAPAVLVNSTGASACSLGGMTQVGA